MLGECNVHVWASISSWLADVGDARGAWQLRQLRATSRRGVVGVDCAVHAGWVALAVHDIDDPDQDGATCRWVDRWVPVSVPECASLPHHGRHALRLEHMLVPQGLLPKPTSPWKTPHTILCETAAIDATVEFARHPRRAEGAGMVAAFRRQELLAGLHASSLAFILDPAYATEQPHTPTVAVSEEEASTVGVVPYLAVAVPLLRSFASGPLAIAADDVTVVPTVTRIDLRGLSGMAVTKDRFLAEYSGLDQVDFSPLRHLRAMGPLCCHGCSALVSVDLSAPMPHLVSIGSMAFSNCESLTAVSFAGLTSVKQIGPGFLQSARRLIHLDTRGLESVESIANSFAVGCVGLQHANLHGLRSLTEVGDAFFADTASLSVVDLSALPNLTRAGADFFRSSGAVTVSTADATTGATAALVTVGNGWFANCPRLRTVDVGGLSRLSSVGMSFLGNGEVLEEITVSTPAAAAAGLVALKTAGPWFLGRCPRLRTVDDAVATMGSLERLGLRAFAECKGLESFACVGLGACADVDHHWLFGCESLRRVSFVGLPSTLTTIPAATLALAECLTKVDTAGLEGVTVIHGQFMQHCAALEEIDTRGLVSVTSIGPSFLMGAARLRRFSAHGLTSLTDVGNSFLSTCLALEHIDTRGMEKVATLGNHFAGGCEALSHVDTSGLVSVTATGRCCHPLCVPGS